MLLRVICCIICVFTGHKTTTDLLNFYIQRGIHVIVWNYRGYGRSSGYPWPKDNRADGARVFEHYKTKLNITHYISHGQSIGGCVATHCASTLTNVHMLIADRAFCDLPSTGGILMGNWAKTGMTQLLHLSFYTERFIC